MIFDDTIAAVSSPPGASARGVIRISGPDALPIADRCFRAADGGRLADAASHSRIEGRLTIGDDLECPAALYLFRAPRSYTREDVVELHLPGSPGVLALVMDELLASGARPAEPGEFTARAFHHGALDLGQAEGVAEMIRARSDAQLRAAQRLLDGALGRDAARARETLADLMALVEAALDFADEDIEFITPRELAERLQAVVAPLRAAARSDARVERLAEAPRVVLAGAPNAGKSTLMNRLTGLDRAICSPIAGTTRDVLCAPLSLPAGEALLCDTAGLWETEGEVDRHAARAARDAIADADVVVWLIDLSAAEGTWEEGRRVPAAMVNVANKADMLSPAERQNALTRLEQRGARVDAVVSARTGEGCDDLRTLLNERLHLAPPPSDAVVLSADLRRAVADALDCVDRAIALARSDTASLSQAELVAAELRLAADRFARLAGEISADDLYDRIFSQFCIGK